MKSSLFAMMVGAAFAFRLINPAFADILATKHPNNFDRGYASTGDCHGPWVNGDGRLTPGGTLELKMALETDSLTRGAAGWLEFRILDAQGNTLASGETEGKSIGPKSPGPARRQEFPAWRRSVATPVVQKAKTLEVIAHCDPPPWGLGGLSGQDVQDGIKLIVAAIASG